MTRVIKDSKKRSTPATSAEPFIFENYLNEMEESTDEAMQLIAYFFRIKQATFTTKGQAQIAIKRHLRAARQVVQFEKQKVLAAIEECKKLKQEKNVDWTIETVLKYLTK